MVFGSVDHLEQTVNLPTKGYPKSHNKFNTRLHYEDQRVVFLTRNKTKQQHDGNGNRTAKTTLDILTPPRHGPFSTGRQHPGTPSHRPARMHSIRSCRSKTREVRWQQSNLFKSIKDKYRAFHKGYSKFRQHTLPTHQALMQATYVPNIDITDNAHYYDPHSGTIPCHQIELAKSQESREMKRMLEFLEDGGTGFMPDKKEGGWIRVMFENWNSLGVSTHSWKIDRLNYLIKRLHIDIVAGCECQCDWTMVDLNHQLTNLLVPGIAKKVVTANNTHERIHRDQKGGTAIAGIGRICDVISEVGYDTTGLGRWTWVKLGQAPHTTRVVSAYLPCKPGRNSRGRTVWEQHSRYFEARGDMRYPSTIFVEDLLHMFKHWIQQGEHVLLAIDANQDVYTGRLASMLKESPYNMHCMLEEAMGEKVPNSHFSGDRKISTFFGTPGIVTGHGMCYPHWFGIGDHRVMLLEISAKAAFNGAYPTIATPAARTLNCKIDRIKRQYCDKLEQLTVAHKMKERLNNIEFLQGEEYSIAHNKWDTELGEYMRCAEKLSTKHRGGSLDYSPTVGQWLKKRAILKWILRWHDGKVPDTRNLLRAARRQAIDNPLQLTRTEVESRLAACMSEIYTLRHQAPALREKHLRWRLGLAKKRGDDSATREINRIIQSEARRRRQRHINSHVKDPRGRAVFRVTVESPDGITIHDTKHEVERQVQQNLQARFSLGKRAPIYRDPLLQEFGTLGDTEAATCLLNGKYIFPPGTDDATIRLLQEVARLRLECDKFPPNDTDITSTDYLAFWSTAKEATSSSKSGRHFGHYKAICSNLDLVHIHVQSINLAARRGDPLVRWRQGVTVLLEKEAGNTSIDRLRAICLLEADFNWWLKVIFAKRMMATMHSQRMLPLEQGALKGKMATDTSLMKQLFFDQANILHEDCSVTSTDAANCYDAGNHTAVSLALQAVGVCLHFILCYLKCVQLMQYFLQTGFGLAETSYGGTSDSICMGLIQGSGAAPGVWTATSTVILGAYKTEGYGASLVSGWSGVNIPIAALLYVDDTDLLHKPQCSTTPLSDFVPWVQQATTFWAHLLQATGGSLKPTKCYWYLLAYKFTNGVASLRPARDFTNISIKIPQPDSPAVTIELKDPTQATKVLGVLCCPSGDGTPMLNHMLSKGVRWSTKVLASALTPHDVWFSLKTQAIPSVRYGLVPLMATRNQLDDAMSKWYYHCLPALGVNRNIRKDWKMLPVQYQGLGLPNLSLEKLADSLKLLQRHWGTTSDLGMALRCSFELIQIETGLHGNFLLRDFHSLGSLATHSWFKCLWELVSFYRVRVILSDTVVSPLREHDKVVMEEVIRILPSTQWTAFNRARKHFRVYFLSQLVLSDGRTVDPTVLSLGQPRNTSFRFPREEPTLHDLSVWVATIKILTSNTLVVSPPLGKFVKPCIESLTWRANISCQLLANALPAGGYNIYHRNTNIITRKGPLFSYSHSTTIDPDAILPASVKFHPDGMVSLLSTSEYIANPPAQTRTFLSRLREGSQARLWQSVVIEDDGDWIPEAAMNSSLVIVHDGSYMPDLNQSVCAAALVILCKHTGKVGSIKICEKTDPASASNYRAELIGGLMASHILRTLDGLIPHEATGVTLFCDNLGVIHHAQHPWRSLPEKQAQSDVLSVFVHNLQKTKIKWEYNHVYGHLDDYSSFDTLTLPQQLNVIADSLAKEAIRDALQTNQYCQPLYPHESTRVFIGGKKATSSFRNALYQDWGARVAQDLFHSRNLISSKYFHLVNWDAVQRAMITLPQMYRVWITKHISGFCGTNKQLSRMQTSIQNRCMCCGKRGEDKLHITRCTEPGRSAMFTRTVEDLINWMKRSKGDIDLILVLQAYLKLRGRTSMRRLCSTIPHLHVMARDFDHLGWVNFTEGRICKSLFQVQQDWLSKTGSRCSISSWSVTFVSKVLDITHRQWLYRNARIHIRVAEGLTQPAHEVIMSKVLTLMGTDPMELLPQHRNLLEWDFLALGAGSTVDRQYWIKNMESALQASRKRRRVNNKGGDSADNRGNYKRSRWL